MTNKGNLNILKHHKETVTSKQLPKTLLEVFIPTKQGEGNQGCLAKPEEVEEQRRHRQEEAAGVDPQHSRSRSEASWSVDPSPVKSVPDTLGIVGEWGRRSLLLNSWETWVT